MAKEKPTGADYDPVHENPDGSLKTVKQKEAERAQATEDLLAEVQEAFHRARIMLPNSQAREDFNVLYQKVRDANGERGQAVDRKIRNV